MSVAVEPALAQQLGPADATEHLAKARAVDAKCRYLSETDHEELAGYTARAEVVVASRQGVTVASGAVKAGKLAGELMDCGGDSETLVRSALDAGRQASRNARAAPQPAAQQAPEPQTLVRAEPHESQVIGGMGGSQEARQGSYSIFEASQSRGSLARYQHDATAYYLELRCRHLRDRQVRVFWDQIVRAHENMVRTYGGRRVRRAVAEAEAMAARRPCGPQSASFISSAFARMR